jgi:hypothetical protein
MSGLIRDCAQGIGGAATRAALIALALGAVATGACIAWGPASVGLGAAAAGWMFAGSIAAGAVAFSAAVTLAKGRWARDALPTADAASAFLAPSAAVLALVVIAARRWIPGLAGAPSSTWLWLCAREIGLAVALALAGRSYVNARRDASAAASRRAILYLVLFTVTLSAWTIDFVMGWSKSAPSTVLPPLGFMGAFLGGIAWVALVGTLRGAVARAETRNDLRKLLFAFAIFWGYLVWAAYLPTWYGNLPDEASPLLLRWKGGWRLPSVGVLLSVFGLPFLLFLPEAARRRPALLAVGAASVLIGVAGERILYLLPPLDPSANTWTIIAGLGAMMGMTGLLVAFIGASLGRHSIEAPPR